MNGDGILPTFVSHKRFLGISSRHILSRMRETMAVPLKSLAHWLNHPPTLPIVSRLAIQGERPSLSLTLAHCPFSLIFTLFSNLSCLDS